MSGLYEDRNQVLGISVGGALLVGALWAIATDVPASSEIAASAQPSDSIVMLMQTSEAATPEPISVEGRLSWGKKLLFPEGATSEKAAAAAAMAAGNYQEAAAQFEKSLRANPNDPEALIYLNNARIGEGEAYAIVAVVPMGGNTTAAQEILRGVAQGQNAINGKGGINGVPLKVAIANDDNEPNIAARLAETFVENPEILGVVGHFSSDATQAAASAYEQGKLVAISPTSTAVELGNEGDYLFRTVPSDRLASQALVDYMSEELDKQKVAVFFNSENSYSQSFHRTFAKALEKEGGKVVAQFDLSLVPFDAEAAMSEAIAQEAEVLVLAPDSAFLEIALAVVEVNQAYLPMLAGDSVYAGKSLALAGDKGVDMVVAVPWHLLNDPYGEFPTTATQLWKGDVNWRTAMAYDATQVLIAAMERDTTRSGIQETLSSSRFQVWGASGEVSFLPSGDREQSVQLVKIQPGTRTKFGYEFVPIP